MRCLREVNILQYKDNRKTIIKDHVIEEYELLLHVNGRQSTHFICTPENMEELAIGYLYSEKIIKDYESIKDIFFEKISENKGKISINLIDNPGEADVSYPLASPFKVDLGKVSEIMQHFNKKSALFIQTGGVHSYAMTDYQAKDILFFAEDIGRHNALDKVVGMMLKKKTEPADKIFLTSGRVSSEIVHKVLSSGVSVLVSHSAPTSRALMLGKKYNIMIIGFARENRLNVYTGLDRGGIHEPVK